MKRDRIFLVGFMCSGKTTVGKLLAEKLQWRFLDVDEEIERREGLTIPEIFKQKGESYFRRLEINVLKDLADRKNVIVSTGGGLGANPEAMVLMKEKGFVVWLKVSFEDFLKRCGNDPSRPLLSLGEEKLKELLKQREKVYSQAHLIVDPEDPESMAERIVAVFY